MPPACTPVAREPIAVASGAGAGVLLLGQRVDERVEQRGHAAGVGVDPAGPVDDDDLGHGPPGPGSAGQPLHVRDGDGGRLVQVADDAGRVLPRRRGPRLISLRAVRPARSQSTIEEALLIASRYAGQRGGRPRRASAAAAAGQRGGDVVQRALGGDLAAEPSATTAKASSRPSVVTTVPARACTPSSVPVLARTVPGAAPASPRSNSVPS